MRRIRVALNTAFCWAVCLVRGHYWQSFLQMPMGGSVIQCRRCRKLELKNRKHIFVDPLSI